MTNLARIPIAILFFTFLASTASGNQRAEFIKENLCEKYVGVFFWDNGNPSQYVNKAINQISIADNVVIASGTGSYVSVTGVTFIHFEWKIDANDYSIVIQESKPTRPDFVTDGIYQGSISADLSSIDTIWKTRTTGQTGTLNLEAVTTCTPPPLG